MRQASLTIFIEGDAMRKSIQIHAPVRVLNVGFDVGKDKLNWETNANDEWFSGELFNTTDTILEVFRKLASLAKRFQYDEVRIICESTGVYHRSLLQLLVSTAFEPHWSRVRRCEDAIYRVQRPQQERRKRPRYDPVRFWQSLKSASYLRIVCWTISMLCSESTTPFMSLLKKNMRAARRNFIML